MRHPFSGVDPDALRAAILKDTERAAEDFPKSLAKIERILRSSYPPHVLATLSAYGLRVGVSAAGVTTKTLISGIEQHHIELLQALALRVPSAEWGVEPAASSDIQIVIDELKQLTHDFYRRRLGQVEAAKTPQDKAILALVEKLRMHTQAVRNWGYFNDVVRISKDLYAPLDERLRQFHGFGVVDTMAATEAAMAIVEERINGRWTALRKVFRARTPQRLVRQYFQHFPYVQGDPEAFIAAIPPGASREAVAARILAHSDIFLVPMLSVTAEEVTQRSGLSGEVVEKALAFLSLEPGALHESAAEHLFLDNPIWTAPFVNLKSHFLCAAPQVLFGYVHDVAAKLARLAGETGALEKRRAAFLESAVEGSIRTALPGAQVWSNQTWLVGPDVYETDLVAKLDHTIVIVEAKSGALSPRGLRGDPARVKRHVRDLVGDPAEQSARLEGLIWRAKAGEASALDTLSVFGEGFADADQIVRISVTLDDFSILASSEGELKDAGWIAPDVDLPCTLNIADLTCCIDILETPAHVIHYFSERRRIQKAIDILADELDFLGFYLETGFNVWGVETQGARLSISGASASVDHYYSSRDAGVTTPKPTPRLRPYFKALIRQIEDRRQPHWLSFAVLVLRSLSYDEQRAVENAMTRVKAVVLKSWRDPDHECSIIVTPPPIRDAALLFHVYPPELRSRRNEILDIVSAQGLETSERRRCVVISRATDQWELPYIYLAMAVEPGRTPFWGPLET